MMTVMTVDALLQETTLAKGSKSYANFTNLS